MSTVSIPSTEEGVTAEQSSSTVSDMIAQLNKLLKVGFQCFCHKDKFVDTESIIIQGDY